MKFYTPKDFGKIIKILNPMEFLNYMLQAGELRSISDNYGDDCKLLCHNSIGWIVLKLHDTIYKYDVMIHVGSYHSYEHSWIQIGDYYLDLTLAQFESDAPPLAITRVGENVGYDSSRVMSIDAWYKSEMPYLEV